ncbi:MAG: M20 family metallo-hydrolase, partial [Synergistaceae bacterium]|nr:M20 family metallo-hydrolase [Synergistaceae bacterium]
SYDKDFVALVADHLEGDFKIDIARSLGGSEDITYMMNRVEELGGRSLHFMFGSDLKAAHHNNRFDFDEESLAMAFKALRRTIELLVEE